MSIHFNPNYDFSDERFHILKNYELKKLKTQLDIQSGLSKTPDSLVKSTLAKLNFELNGIHEGYGNVLIYTFNKAYLEGNPSIRQVISDFSKYTVSSPEEWKERYSDGYMEKNEDFRQFGIELEIEFLQNMADWKLHHANFKGIITDRHYFIVDIKEREAKYYYELLALYRAKRDFYQYLTGKNDIATAEDDFNTESNTGEYTAARRILAARHIFIELGIQEAFVNKTDIAKMIHLLGSKEVTKISNSPIYNKLKKSTASEKRDLEDYQFVLNHFENLKGPVGSGIDNIIKRLRNDMK